MRKHTPSYWAKVACDKCTEEGTDQTNEIITFLGSHVKFGTRFSARASTEDMIWHADRAINDAVYEEVQAQLLLKRST